MNSAVQNGYIGSGELVGRNVRLEEGLRD